MEGNKINNSRFTEEELRVLKEKENIIGIPLIPWITLVQSYLWGDAGPDIYCIWEGELVRTKVCELNEVAFVSFNKDKNERENGIYLLNSYGNSWFISREDAVRKLK